MSDLSAVRLEELAAGYEASTEATIREGKWCRKYDTASALRELQAARVTIRAQGEVLAKVREVCDAGMQLDPGRRYVSPKDILALLDADAPAETRRAVEGLDPKDVIREEMQERGWEWRTWTGRPGTWANGRRCCWTLPSEIERQGLEIVPAAPQGEEAEVTGA